MLCRVNSNYASFLVSGALGMFLWCAVFFFPFAYAKEESFDWGQPVSSVTLLLSAQKKDFYANDDYTRLTYSDRAFDQPCQITLFFNSATKSLEKMEMEWAEAALGKKIKKTLIDGYGQPDQASSEAGEYFVWNSSTDKGKTVLECRTDKVILTTYSPLNQE